MNKYGGENTISSCPCKKCKNGKGLQSLSNISLHLLKNGIELTYITWCFHGESLIVDETVEDVVETVIGNVADDVAVVAHIIEDAA